MFPDELRTLPKEDPILQNVRADESVLRRFNPDNPEHAELYSVDEGRVATPRLKTGALTGFSADGCSVLRPLILEIVPMALADVLDPPKYVKLARAAVAVIEEFVYVDPSGKSVAPFSVHPDSYPDDPPFAKHGVAHALLKIEALPKAQKTVAVGSLARTAFQVLSLP